jgi:hypothetical protein
MQRPRFALSVFQGSGEKAIPYVKGYTRHLSSGVATHAYSIYLPAFEFEIVPSFWSDIVSTNFAR